MDSRLAGYNYRLGYQLEKEFDRSLLFRFGCPANGPCMHVLVDKYNGKEIEHFDELIYKAEKKSANCLVYFSNYNQDSITVEFIETNKKYKIPVNAEDFGNDVPEQQFDKSSIEGNKLILYYRKVKRRTMKGFGASSIIIDLKKYHP